MLKTVKKSTIIVLGILLLILAGSMLLLRNYEVDLVQSIVLHAVIQKAPQGYPRQQRSQAFAAARRRAEQDNREEAYLEQLFAFSRRLEKVQSLSRGELEELLDEVREQERGGRNFKIPNSKPDPEPETWNYRLPLLTLAGGVPSLSNPDFREELSSVRD